MGTVSVGEDEKVLEMMVAMVAQGEGTYWHAELNCTLTIG